MKALTDDVFVSGQIRVEDVERLAGAGIKTIINNRPDGEMMRQPSSREVEAAAKAHDMAFISLPMAGGVTPELIAGSIEAYKNSQTPILAFCGSGTRSTALWCFAHVKDLGVDAALQTANHAGYNLEQLREPLKSFVG